MTKAGSSRVKVRSVTHAAKGKLSQQGLLFSQSLLPVLLHSQTLPTASFPTCPDQVLGPTCTTNEAWLH